MGYQSVRTERWKYIRYRELKGMDELYDLRADPYELRNVIGAPATRDAAAAASRGTGSSVDRRCPIALIPSDHADAAR